MSERVTLGELSNVAEVSRRLVGGGLSAPAANAKAELFASGARKILDRGVPADVAARAFFVPGRIEVLGKHTDYAGGRSLVAATELGFCFVCTDRDDSTLRISADDEQAEFQISPDLTPTLGHWSNYPMTVARRLARNFPPPLCGAELAFGSDLPPASGMSSSSALMVAVYLAIAAVNDLPSTAQYVSNIDGAESLAGYLGTVENGQSFAGLAGDKGVGTFGGSQDHTAILCCRPGRLSRYSFCPVRSEGTIPFPDRYVFLIASSGVVAEKTGAARDKYNRASALARAATDAWNANTGRQDAHLAAAVAAENGSPEHIGEILSAAGDGEFAAAELLQRFEHFYAESEQIIPAACEALTAGDVAEFGRQVDRSQELTETLLCNQVPETVFLAQSARELGAAAASAFGAGFGGSVWALAKKDAAEDIGKQWAERYRQEYPGRASAARFLVTRPGPAAFLL